MESDMSPNDNMLKSEIPTRFVEICVNRVINVLKEDMGLRPIEVLLVFKEASKHISKVTGVTLESTRIIPQGKTL